MYMWGNDAEWNPPFERGNKGSHREYISNRSLEALHLIVYPADTRMSKML